MKSGIILYVSGNAPEGWSEHEEIQFRRIQLNADRVEIITDRTGHFDINDAWWRLTAKGMSMITCRAARFDDAGKIEITNRELRLCG